MVNGFMTLYPSVVPCVAPSLPRKFPAGMVLVSGFAVPNSEVLAENALAVLSFDELDANGKVLMSLGRASCWQRSTAKAGTSAKHSLKSFASFVLPNNFFAHLVARLNDLRRIFFEV
jgi:hypothetical protein